MSMLGTPRQGLTIKNNDLLKLIIAILVMLLFSSDRNLLVTHYIFGRSNIVYLSILSISIVTSFLLFQTISQGKVVVKSKHKKLIIASLALSFYFFCHEFTFGDGLVSARFAVALLIISLSLTVSYNLFFVFKIIGYVGAVISSIIIAQQILVLSATGGDLSSFEVSIPGELWGRWPSCDFVTTYGLGMYERCVGSQDTMLFGFTINRAIFFSTEPKYAASILLITFSALLISRTNPIIKAWFVVAHVMALLFVGSASAILILASSGLLVYARYFGPRLYTLLVFLLPIFIFPLILAFTLNFLGLDGFLLNRIMSATSNVGSGSPAMLIFGESYGACTSTICGDSQGLLSKILGKYGLVGLGLFGIFLYLVIGPMFRLLRHKKSDFSVRFGLTVLLNAYVVFNIYFFGNLFDMYGLFIILTLILVPNYINDKSKLE